MAVVDELASSPNGRNELGAVDDGVQARLEQADQVFRGVTLATVCFVVDGAELLFADVAVVALKLLLGAELYNRSRTACPCGAGRAGPGRIRDG